MTVRHATALDIPRLIELGRQMHAEAPAYKRLGFDDAKVTAMLERAMKDGILLVAATPEETIVGGFMGMLGEYWFSRDKCFIDLAVFVEPGRRGGITAARLVKGAKAWCQEQGVQPADVQFGVSTGVHPEATGQFYEALGFQLSGGIYRLKEY